MVARSLHKIAVGYFEIFNKTEMKRWRLSGKRTSNEALEICLFSFSLCLSLCGWRMGAEGSRRKRTSTKITHVKPYGNSDRLFFFFC